MLGLFLDDERNPSDVDWVSYPPNIEWIVVRSYDEFRSVLTDSDQHFDLISFDHDLADFLADGTERTGMTCIRFLEGLCFTRQQPPPVCVFHTQNPVGLANMLSFYECWKRLAPTPF